jgi:hypothetical protein
MLDGETLALGSEYCNDVFLVLGAASQDFHHHHIRYPGNRHTHVLDSNLDDAVEKQLFDARAGQDDVDRRVRFRCG